MISAEQELAPGRTRIFKPPAEHQDPDPLKRRGWLR
jgi:hypothetical protein